MSQSAHPIGSAMSYDPYGPDSYKRAIYLPAPARFTIEFLEPAKQGHNYSYGMRINAINSGDRTSTSSTRSLREYDIWRRWEDCLWFQDALEQEYTRLAREKKQRLLRGKGVKKNGFYMQDRAASFESLPPGPHPDSVAQDIHEYIPRLTKKGTFFRASQATVNQQNNELKALVQALYQDDLPALVIEMRETNTVTDFFGYWRRDFDLYESSQKRESRSSARSVISFFSSSSSSLSPRRESGRSSQHDSSSISTRFRPVTSQDIPSQIGTPELIRSRIYPGRHQAQSALSFSSPPAARPRALSTASSTASTDSSSSGSDRSCDTSTISSIPVIVDDSPIKFGHNPQQYGSNEKPDSMSEVFPKETEIKADSLALMSSFAVKQRRRSASANLHLNRPRPFRDHPSPPHSPTKSELATVLEQEQPDDEPSHPTVRESWMSTDSAATYLEGLKLSLPAEPSNRASILTVMTTDSAEAIIGRGPQRSFSRSLPSSPIKSHNPPKSRFSQAVTLSDFDIWTDVDEDEEIESALGTGMTDVFPRPISFCDSLLEFRPESSLGYNDTPTPTATETPLPSLFFSDPPSPTTSTMSDPCSIATTSSIVPEGMVSIKAGLNQTIVLLRVSNTTSYEELRERLCDKFIGQEGLPLSKLFTIALTNPLRDRELKNGGRGRSGSVSSTEHMEFVRSQNDWDRVIASYEGGKLTLRLLDTFS